jgi:hypothetical protein
LRNRDRRDRIRPFAMLDCLTVTDWSKDMKQTLSAITARNLLIGVGAYYLSWWVASPLAIGFEKFTHWIGIRYYGDFVGGVVMPIVLALPYAVVAAVVGASVVWLVESDRPIGWTLVPTFLYALGLFRPSHWVRPPTPLERVGDAIRMALPAVACIVAGIVAAKRRADSQRISDRMSD